MRLNEVLRLLLGASAVYLVVAACGAEMSGRDGESSHEFTDRHSSVSDSSMLGSIATDMLRPVRDAAAQQVPLVETTVVCDREAMGILYAVKEYPGRRAAELASVVALCIRSQPLDIDGVSYHASAGSATWVRDGAVAVGCGTAQNLLCSSITFVSPAL